MCAAGIVMFHRRSFIPAYGRHNIAFGNDFDFIAQIGYLQSLPKQFFSHIAAINIGLIHGGDALL